MLDRARARLGPSAHLVRQRLPELAIEGTFDAAISTFDGLNYLTPAELRSTFSVVADRLRPEGWLVFDLHTDATMFFAASHPSVEGEADGMHFVITNEVDIPERTCDTGIRVTRLSDGDSFSESHRQYFFTDDEVRGSLRSAGFAVVSVTDEYSDEQAGSSTLRATWTGRLDGRPL